MTNYEVLASLADNAKNMGARAKDRAGSWYLGEWVVATDSRSMVAVKNLVRDEIRFSPEEVAKKILPLLEVPNAKPSWSGNVTCLKEF